MKKYAVSAVLVFAGLAGSYPVLAADGLTSYETAAPFADVVADLEDAIVNRGYVVDYHGHIGDMLSRTAGDVGASKALYKGAEFVQFCSATVSRAAMEVDLANIGFCPYVLFAFEPETAPGTVIVGFRRLPDGKGRDAVNELLDEIVKEASGN